jgi:hypothetical protein
MRAAAKPSRVLSGQVWRCVGIDGELEVVDIRPEFVGFYDDIDMRSVGASGPVTVRTREVDMLGLKEWSFVRGPR